MIVLRDVRPDDKEMIRRWRNSPEVARYMYNDHHISAEEHDKWFQGIFDDPKRIFWIISHNDKDVGLASLYDIDRGNGRCYWAFYLAEVADRTRGLGGFVEYAVMERVFGDLGLNRLCCEVLAENRAVLEMHKRFGFAQEGCYRQHVYKGGKPVDVILMAILRDEWLGTRSRVGMQLNKIEGQIRKRGYLREAAL